MNLALYSHKRKQKKPHTLPMLFENTSIKDEDLNGIKTCTTSIAYDNQKLTRTVTNRAFSLSNLKVFNRHPAKPKPKGKNRKTFRRKSSAWEIPVRKMKK